MCISVHVAGQHDEGKQARFSSRYGLQTCASQQHHVTYVVFQATEPSRQLYTSFLEKLGQSYKPEKIHGRTKHSFLLFYAHWFFNVEDGKFGAMMNVTLTNEVRKSQSMKISRIDQTKLGSRHIYS